MKLQAWLPFAAALVGIQVGFTALMAAVSGYPYLPPYGRGLFIMGQFFGFGALIHVAIVALKVRGSPRPARAIGMRLRQTDWTSAMIGAALLASASVTANWSKTMIPSVTGFRWDPFLADLDHALFGTDPWTLFRIDALSRFYALAYVYWFLVAVAVMLALLLAKPTANRAVALVSFFGIYLVCGTVGHFAMPSGGPIFFERLGYGPRFAHMVATNDVSYNFFSNYLWRWHLTGLPNLGTGISAMPSLHVAISAWLVFAGRALWRHGWAPAAGFYLVIWAASIASGWHYATDGLAGTLCAVAIIGATKAAMKSRAPLYALGARPAFDSDG